jgi:hypothetical protein
MKFSMLFIIIQFSIVSLLFSKKVIDNVSGVWDQPQYIISNDIKIAYDDTLTIMNDVTVKFESNCKLQIL